VSKPYKTSNDIIETVKRNGAIPIAQVTFSNDDILAFANEEMDISQVPSVLQYHESYFTYTDTVPLEDQKSRYPIPERAIGMSFRALYWQDQSGNLYEMTQINPDDQSYFQRNVGANQAIHKYFVEGNDVVLTPLQLNNPTGSLVFKYFLRPNRLVVDERAAISKNFVKNIQINNASIANGDTVTLGSVVFTAGTDFTIGMTAISTATSLVSAIMTEGTYTAGNGTPSTDTVAVSYTVLSTTFETSNTSAFIISTRQIIECTADVPANITNASKIDFLQTTAGHKTFKFDVTLGNNVISGSFISFAAGDIPTDFKVGDYIASQYECIIPQILDDLHVGLSHRTLARILSSLGDKEGLTDTNAKIGEIEQRQGTLLDNRGSGDPKKILNRHSLLRYAKSSSKRRI